MKLGVDMTEQSTSTADRRSVLAAGAAVTATGIAGCSDLLGGDEDILSWHAGARLAHIIRCQVILRLSLIQKRNMRLKFNQRALVRPMLVASGMRMQTLH